MIATNISPVLSSARAAIRDPHWREAMQLEFDTLRRNSTWQLVPRPPDAPVVTGKWVFKHKLKPDGSLDRYKARAVHGFTQKAGVDFGEAFSPVVKLATIKNILTIIANRLWPVHQLDVSNAFLHSHLHERVLCQQPVGLVDPNNPDAVSLLSKSLYGLKQAPRAWYMRFAGFIQSIGFQSTIRHISVCASSWKCNCLSPPVCE